MAAGTVPPLDPQDIPKSTWKLFDAIAEATDFEELHEAVKRTNDQLAPIRSAKQSLVGDAYDELVELYGHWAARDLTSLETCVRAFYQRRIAMVPEIVAPEQEARLAPLST